MTNTELLIRLQNLRADQSDMAQERIWPPAARIQLQRDAAALHQAITTLTEWGDTIEAVNRFSSDFTALWSTSHAQRGRR